ncbi:MAG: 3-hydroxyacyl-CoA dehydrogenase NAD-binding domain-containing protein [Bacteroidota bacterium]|nr:3-hydroxyacyl-CoA dehydrogenase NAD-binding domain-containing protein [Bacteroidota bacterium]
MNYSIEQIKKIAIVGAGTMGLGITQLSAMAGYNTMLLDVNEENLSKALNTITLNLQGGVDRGKLSLEEMNSALSKIETSNDLVDANADLVIEAIVESLKIKRDVFSKIARINSEKTILASNTSSIPITQIAAGVYNPERVAGIHFFNPAHVMKLVEIIKGVVTDNSVVQTLYDLALKMGKSPVMAKDAPGFIVNRVARHYYVESLKTLEENVANVEIVDQLLENAGFKMGAFKLMDLIGVNTNYDVTTSIWQQFNFDSKFRPSRIQQQKVEAGHHGQKTGIGFYEYKKP